MKKESDILETTLSIAAQGYAEAYRFLRDAYTQAPENHGPQTLYFLACLAGGTNHPETALAWLRKAIAEQAWWYRPEVLEDDDLASLREEPAFLALKAVSDARYAEAVSKTKAVFSWQAKTADALFLAVHGNTQNGQTAREDWQPILAGAGPWQLETIQSAEPDGYGTYRWSYDSVSYRPVANAMETVQAAGYRKIVCGGFSAGCDMLLRAVTFSAARCDMLVLQSPWLPILEDHADDLLCALQQKNITLRIFCGSADADCLPMAKQLYALALQSGLDAALTVQPNSRHQFPAEAYAF